MHPSFVLAAGPTFFGSLRCPSSQSWGSVLAMREVWFVCNCYGPWPWKKWCSLPLCRVQCGNTPWGLAARSLWPASLLWEIHWTGLGTLDQSGRLKPTLRRIHSPGKFWTDVQSTPFVLTESLKICESLWPKLYKAGLLIWVESGGASLLRKVSFVLILFWLPYLDNKPF